LQRAPHSSHRSTFTHILTMATSLDLAVAWRRQHPKESYQCISERFQVNKTTLYHHFKGNHRSHRAAAPSALSHHQEAELIAQINAYAKRGTLLTPAHVKDLAESVFQAQLGRNWTGRFIQRHSKEISSQFHAFRDISRLKADTAETREAWNKLASTYFAFLKRNCPSVC
jgi:hypothetical protein